MGKISYLNIACVLILGFKGDQIMFFWKISLRRRGNSNSPVHSISMSEWFLFFPPGPGPGSDFTEEALDEQDDEDDREEIGLSPASSRGPIFDCFLSLTISNHSSCVCLSAKRFLQSSSRSITVLSPSNQDCSSSSLHSTLMATCSVASIIL